MIKIFIPLYLSLLATSQLIAQAPISAPSDLKLTPTSHSISLSWKDNADNESGYKIYRKEKLLALLPPDTTDHLDKGLHASTSYRYTVKATNNLYGAKRQKGTSGSYIRQATDLEHGLRFDAKETMRLKSIQLYTQFSQPSTRTFLLKDSRNQIVSQKEVLLHGGKERITLNFLVPESDGYRLTVDNPIGFFEETLDLQHYPFEIDQVAVITNSLTDNNHYGLFYGWEVNVDDEDLNPVHRAPITVALQKEENGLSLHSLKVNGQEMLNADSTLFTLTLQNLNTQEKAAIHSRNGWRNVSIQKKGDDYDITLSQPINAYFPSALSVHLSIKIDQTHSKWDMDVSGVGDNHSLIDLSTPSLHLKLLQDAKLLIPKYSGVLKEINENIDLVMDYPAGWKSTMQFFAYYNQQSGLYIGNHDPKAAKKRFVVKKDDVNHELIYTTHIIPPNKTKPNNNFSLSGIFELDGFEGDWYDAAKIYKKWARKNADYYPHMTPERKRRQHKIGEIALWASSQVISEYMRIEDKDQRKKKIDNYLNFIKYEMEDFAETLSPLPVAFIWNEWYKLVMDRDYPSIFYPKSPLKDEIKSTIDNLHQNHPNLTIMPYINGFIFDMEAGHFTQDARDASVKKSDGSPYTQRWNHHNFAIMDPSQSYWQNQISGAARVVLKGIDADGIYIDQVTASSMREDMDEHHGHPLAGGSWWREGYAKMFSKIDAFRGDKFTTSEGMADYMADHIDGFFLHYRGVNHMVPAYQVVYGGKVQLFGLQMDTGAYDTLSYYMSRMRAFIFGVQPGAVTQWLLHDQRESAKINYAFIKKLATMHYTLREFFAYGEHLKDIVISNDGGQLETVWKDYGEDQHIKMPALLHGIYRSEDGNKIAIILGNASKEKNIHYTFDIDPARYGLSPNAKVTKIDFNSQSSTVNSLIDARIAPHTAVAYILSQD